MIKPIRPPYLVILSVILAVIGLLCGGIFWKIRRSPDFYEGRADNLVKLENYRLAAAQYSAAAVHADTGLERSRLLTKKAKALSRTRRESVLEAYKDGVKSAESLLLAIRAAPGAFTAMDTFLNVHFKQAEFTHSESGWAAFETLLTQLEKAETENKALEKYRILFDLHKNLMDWGENRKDLEADLGALEELVKIAPSSPDSQFYLNLTRLFVAADLHSPEPGRAYSLVQQATAFPAGLADGRDAARIGNWVALTFISELLQERKTAQQYRELEAQIHGRFETHPDSETRLAFAKCLLVAGQFLPRDRQGTDDWNYRSTAEKVLWDLYENRQAMVLSAWLLLQFQGDGATDNTARNIFADFRRKTTVGQGLLERSVDFSLRVAAIQTRISDLLEKRETTFIRHRRESLLNEARDDYDFLESLQSISKTGQAKNLYLKGLVHWHASEKRRALAELLAADQRMGGQGRNILNVQTTSRPENRTPSSESAGPVANNVAEVKLAIGGLLLDLGENGTAARFLGDAWKRRRQLTARQRLKTFQQLGEAYIRSGREETAAEMIENLGGANQDFPGLNRVAGTLLRRLSGTLAMQKKGRAEVCIDRALELLGAATQGDPSDFEAWYELGLTHYRNDNPAGAETAFLRTLQIAPNHPHAARALLAMYLRQQRYQEGEALVRSQRSQAGSTVVEQQVSAILDNAAENPPDLEKALLLLAPDYILQMRHLFSLYLEGGDPRAPGVLDELCRWDPNHEIVVRLRFAAALKSQDYEAIESLTDAVLSPLIAPSIRETLQGEFQLFNEHPYDAIKNFQRALRTDPFNSRVHARLGQAQQLGLLTDEAIESFSAALRINPAAPNLQVLLSRALYKAGKLEQAREVLAGVALKGVNPGGIADEFLRYEGFYGDAADTLYIRQRVAGNAPEDEENRRRLARMKLAEGDREAARTILSELIREGEETVLNHLAMAELVARCQSPEQAIDFVMKNLASSVSDVPAEKALAVAEFLHAHQAGAPVGLFLERAISPHDKGTVDFRRAMHIYIAWLLDDGQSEKARQQAEAFLEQNPLPRLYTDIGTLFLEANAPGELLSIIEQAPPTVGTLALKAQAKIKLGDVDAAQNDLEKAVEAAPDDPRPYIWRAQILTSPGSREALPQAEIDLRKAITLQPKLAYPRILLARLLENTGRLDEAERELVGLVKTWPEREEYRIWQCRIALKKQSIEAAAAVVMEARRAGMRGPVWDYFDARVQVADEQFLQAIQHLLKSVHRFETPEPFELLLELLLEKKLFPEAESVLRNLSENLHSPKLFIYRAVLMDRAGREKQCMQNLNQALSGWADQPDTADFSLIAKVLPPSRLADFIRQLLDQQDKDVPKLLLLLNFAENIGASREAAFLAGAMLPHIASTDPARFRTRILLANALESSGQARRAEKVYLDLMDDFPDLRLIKNNLAYLYATELNTPDKAEKLALQALAGPRKTDEVHAAFLDTLGLAQLAGGKTKDAIENFQAALRLYDSPEIKSHLGLALIEDGSHLEARAMIEDCWRRVKNSNAASGREAESIRQLLPRSGVPVGIAEEWLVVKKYFREGKTARVAELLKKLPPVSGNSPFLLDRFRMMIASNMKDDIYRSLAQIRERIVAPQVLLELADMLESTMPEEAESIYRDVGRGNPPADIIVSIAQHRLEKKQFAAAEKRFSQLLVDPSPKPAAIIGFLAAHIAAGGTPLADDWLAGVPDDYKLSPGAQLLLAACRSDFETMTQSIRYANTDPHLTTGHLIIAANALLEQPKADLAVLDLVADKALQMNPACSECLLLKANVLERLGKTNAATEVFYQASIQAPFNEYILYQLGLNLAEHKQLDNLQQLMTRYELFYGRKAWYATLQGEAALLDGQSGQAEQAFRTALETAPDADRLLRLVQLLIQQQKFSQALTAFETYDRLTAAHAPLLAFGATLYLRLGQQGKGSDTGAMALDLAVINEVERVIDILAPAVPAPLMGPLLEAFRKAGVGPEKQALFIQRYWREAEEDQIPALTEIYRQADPESVAKQQTGLVLARVLQTHGEPQAAGRIYRALMQAFPRAPEVLEQCAWVNLQSGSPENLNQASVFAGRAVTEAEKDSNPRLLSKCLATQARVQYALNLLTPAHRSISRSVTLYPRADNTFLLAEVLAARGFWLAAEKELEKARERSEKNPGDVSPAAFKVLEKRIEDRSLAFPSETD